MDRTSDEYRMRVTKFLDDNEAAVEQHGVTFVGVFPTEEDGYHFAYSIGRTLSGLPELIVTGTSTHGQGFLQWVHDNWADHPGPNIIWPIGDKGALMTITVPESIAETHNTFARAIADVKETLQVVWRDDDGLWPWDKGDPTLPILDKDWSPPVLVD